MTVYEQELRKLFEHSDLVDRPQFSGRVCVGDLGKDLRVRVEFLSTHISSQYDAIRLTVLNRTEGVVDRTLLRFQDVWGKKQVPNNPNFRSGVIPHLWDEKARAMGLRLLESCQQMNVYGPVWTDGMWQEIYKAGELGIPVLTDQKTIGRTPPARHPKRKER